MSPTLRDNLHKLAEPDREALPHMRQDSTSRQVTSAVTDGWLEGGSFFGSILSGTLLGYFADRWLDTDPWLVVLGVVVGAYSGFVRVWRYSKKMEEGP